MALVEGGGRAGEGKNNRRPHLDRAGPPKKIKLSSDYHVDERSRRHSLSLSTFRPRLNELEVDQHYDNYDDGLLLCTNLGNREPYLKPKISMIHTRETFYGNTVLA